MAELPPEKPADEAAAASAAAAADDPIGEATPAAEAATADLAASNADAFATEAPPAAHSDAPSTEIDLSQLPAHTRSMLKIEVAVTVTLARQRRPIQEITELGPGMLVKFEKTYDEP